MRYSPYQYAEALYELTAGKRDGELRDIIRKFLKRLAVDGALGFIRDIALDFESIARAHAGVTVGKIFHAGPIARKKIRTALGKKTEVTFAEDPRLIGGPIVEVGDLRVDASIRRRLQELRRVFR